MTHNQGVAGSIPAGPTFALRSFSVGGLFFFKRNPLKLLRATVYKATHKNESFVFIRAPFQGILM
jgi:hypothetical protein